MMATCVVIGSASGVPVPNRSHASLLFRCEKSEYLFDVGEGCSSSLLQCGIDHHNIGTVFISHMHPDHCSGLPMLIQMMYLADRTAPLKIYLPVEGLDAVSNWLTGVYIFPEKLPFLFTLSPILPGTLFHDENLRVEACGNKHLQGYRELVASSYSERTLESYSFVIELERKKIVSSGDLLSLEDIRPICRETEVLFLEVTHVGLDDIVPFVAEHSVKKTVLTHIPPELEGKEDHILSVASKYGVENIIVASDGLTISL